MKPRIFVGSSKERLSLAYAIQECLAHDGDVTVWTQGVFELSKSGLESLLSLLDRVDYGIFVFAPDDLVKLRGKKLMSARDNVVFELGLFMGRLGRDRSFIVAPDGHDLHLPSDLIGAAPATYDGVRAEKEPVASLGPACNAIRAVLAGATTGTVTRIDTGFRLSLSPVHSIDLITGAIQDAHPDPEYGAVVLPANSSFDDACIHDANSALGAFFQRHFRPRISQVQAVIQAELKKTAAGGGKTHGSHPMGTAIYMHRPLGTKHQIIISAVTEKLQGAGIRADTLSLIAAIKGVLRLASDKRLTELWMPVIGTGHGGLDFSVALTMILAQLSHGILREGYHSIHRVVIQVHDPECKRAAQIERLAKAYPSVARM